MATMKLKEQFRFMQVDPSTVDEENRTLDVSFSSEQPVDQWYGREILSHGKGAVDMTRLQAGAPLLWNHDRSDIRGVVESAKIGDDKRGHAKVRFSKSQRGEEAFNDMKDGILRGVSVGYRVRDMKQSGGTRDKPEYTVTKWQPTEISLAPVPADHTVGYGRADANEEHEVNVELMRDESAAPAVQTPPPKEENRMDPKELETAQAAARAEAVTAERERVAAIQALQRSHGHDDLARQLIEGGRSLEEARTAYLEKLGARQVPVGSGQANALDLTDKEKRQYSLMRAIRAQADGSWKDAGFERECSDALGKQMGRSTDGFFMPTNIVVDPLRGERSASATAYGATINAPQGGANLVATNLLAGSFIDILRHKARVMQMGATVLAGLVGNINIPRQKGASTVYWVSPEGTDLTESEAAFDMIGLTPHTVGAYSQITRQMMMQSTPDIELLVRNDLAKVMGLGIDLAALMGTGAAGQPLGIFNQAGIGSVVDAGGNGSAPTIDDMISLETQVAIADADEGALAYMSNARVVGALKKLKSTTGQYLWTDSPIGQRSGTPGELNGYTVARTNQVPSNLTKGTGTNLSAIFFGNWNEVVIGEWGSMEILLNPYGAGFKSGTLEIRALQTLDINIRHAASFAIKPDCIA